MMILRSSVAGALMLLAVGVTTSEAGHWRRGGGCCDQGCNNSPCQSAGACQTTYQSVERTIMVPTMVSETRSVNVTECRAEQRETSCTVYRNVPETRQVSYQYTVMVPQTRTRTINYTVCKPVMETHDQQYTVMIPETQTRTVNYTVCKPVMETQTQQYTVMVPETRTRTVNYTVCKPVYETQTREYTVMVPENRTRTVNVTVCKPVMETQTRQYSVLVPYTETRQGTRPVCRMVPVTVMRTVCEDQGHWEDVAVQNCQPACAPGCAANEQPAANDASASSPFQLVGWRHRQGGNCYAPSNCAPSGCAPSACAQPQRRWVAKIVTKQVPVTCMQPPGRASGLPVRCHALPARSPHLSGASLPDGRRATNSRRALHRLPA